MTFSCVTTDGLEYQAREIELYRYWRLRDRTSKISSEWEYLPERRVPVGIVNEAKKYFKRKELVSIKIKI